MVRAVSVQLAPPAIADAQIIDYTERTADSAVALVTAAANRPPAPALPEQLPVPPPPPLSYMNPYREQIQANDLSYRDQAQLVLALRGHLQDEDERDTARGLLVELRRRQDIVESIARDIDELLASVPAPAPAVATPSTWTSPTASSSAPTAPSSTPTAAATCADRAGRRPHLPGTRTPPVDTSSATGTAPVGPITSARAASRPSTPSTARRRGHPRHPRTHAMTAAATPGGPTTMAPFSGGLYVVLAHRHVLHPASSA